MVGDGRAGVQVSEETRPDGERAVVLDRELAGGGSRNENRHNSEALHRDKSVEDRKREGWLSI